MGGGGGCTGTFVAAEGLADSEVNKGRPAGAWPFVGGGNQSLESTRAFSDEISVSVKGLVHGDTCYDEGASYSL